MTVLRPELDSGPGNPGPGRGLSIGHRAPATGPGLLPGYRPQPPGLALRLGAWADSEAAHAPDCDVVRGIQLAKLIPYRLIWSNPYFI